MTSNEKNAVYLRKGSPLFLFQDEHIYLACPLSVTQIVGHMLGTTPSPQVKAAPWFKRAGLVGSLTHLAIEEVVLGKLKRISTVDVGEHTNEVQALLHNFKPFWKKVKKSDEVWTTEEPLLRAVKSFYLMAGTFDAYNETTQTLFEWKTTSTDKWEEWLWQVRIYAWMMGAGVKQIVIYNLRTKNAMERAYVPLTHAEVERITNAAKDLTANSQKNYPQIKWLGKVHQMIEKHKKNNGD